MENELTVSSAAGDEMVANGPQSNRRAGNYTEDQGIHQSPAPAHRVENQNHDHSAKYRNDADVSCKKRKCHGDRCRNQESALLVVNIESKAEQANQDEADKQR